MKKVITLHGLFLVVTLSVVTLSGCSASRVVPTQDIWDPLEPVNRGVFWFNERFETYVADPVARGYNDVASDRVRLGVTNFFRNLKQPIDVANALLQLKVGRAFTQSGRFLINSTVGVLGVMDVATPMGLAREPEDFGITLARWGVPPGPYLVLPILGPSNFRDTIGIVGDGFADPTFYVEYTDLSWQEKLAIEGSLVTVDYINRRARMLDAVKSAKEAAFDYYYTLQGAYYQSRRSEYYDGHPPQEDSDEEEGRQQITLEAAE